MISRRQFMKVSVGTVGHKYIADRLRPVALLKECHV